MAAGGIHSLEVRSDGSIAAWGDNSHGQCDVPLPNDGFVAVVAGHYHSLGLRENGVVVAWGSQSDDYRHGAFQCNVPVPNSGFTAIGTGARFDLGVKENGSVVAWGRVSYAVPAPNTDFESVTAMRVDNYAMSVGLKLDGSAVAWRSRLLL